MVTGHSSSTAICQFFVGPLPVLDFVSMPSILDMSHGVVLELPPLLSFAVGCYRRHLHPLISAGMNGRRYSSYDWHGSSYDWCGSSHGRRSSVLALS
jgi:hypothetical protein